MLTCDALINSNFDSIDIIGYGSLLNTKSNSYSNNLTPVVIKGFKRVYNIKLIPDSYSDEWIDNLKKYLAKYGINTDSQIKKLNQENATVLNCIKTNDYSDVVNGLLTTVKKCDFLEFSRREMQYNLVETEYGHFDIDKGEVTFFGGKNKAYVLMAKEEEIITNGNHFIPYHDNVREGAYSYGRFFGNVFDESTQF